MKAGNLSESGLIRPHLTPLECGIIFGGIPAGAISRIRWLDLGNPGYKYFKSPQHAPTVVPEHDLSIRQTKLKNTVRWLMGKDQITHLGL